VEIAASLAAGCRRVWAIRPDGGFASDRLALRAVHRSRRSARVQVLGLDVIEYLLLAPAACVCALILLLEPSRGVARAHVAMDPRSTAWVPAPVVGDTTGNPWLLRALGGPPPALARDQLAGVEVLRSVVLRPLERPWALLGMAIYWAAEIACFGFALRCFGVAISVPALVVAYATGYAASRRSLPLGGAGITEVLLTVSLIAVHVHAAQALLSVVAYRLANCLALTLPALLAHSSFASLLEAQAVADLEDARATSPIAHARRSAVGRGPAERRAPGNVSSNQPGRCRDPRSDWPSR
jgi:hypothetical protein